MVNFKKKKLSVEKIHSLETFLMTWAFIMENFKLLTNSFILGE